MSEKIESRLHTKATGELKEQVKKELDKPDPEKAQAKKVLEDKEDNEDTGRDE